MNIIYHQAPQWIVFYFYLFIFNSSRFCNSGQPCSSGQHVLAGGGPRTAEPPSRSPGLARLIRCSAPFAEHTRPRCRAATLTVTCQDERERLDALPEATGLWSRDRPTRSLSPCGCVTSLSRSAGRSIHAGGQAEGTKAGPLSCPCLKAEGELTLRASLVPRFPTGGAREVTL